jgi:hypothetical protein
MPTTSPIGSRISKNNSFIQKKPILKKRSMSEIMLQRSLSASSLLKQAAAAVQAQQASTSSSSRSRPGLARATSDYSANFALAPRRRRSHENTSLMPSIASSGMTSPNAEKKHIHFNEQVSQCIALEMKGDDDEDEVAYPSDGLDDSDSDPDDGAIMMKRSTSKRNLPPMKKHSAPSSTSSSDIETIAMLPSTTLKYREDTPEPESALKHAWSLSSLSASPSQETLRPTSSGATRFPLPNISAAFDDDDDDDDDDEWSAPPLPPRRDSVSLAQDRLAGLQISSPNGVSEGDNDAPRMGMRRTPSGMFMPLEQDEDDIVSEGLFGRVVETVNTARDIAHVIWNVGWRR